MCRKNSALHVLSFTVNEVKYEVRSYSVLMAFTPAFVVLLGLQFLPLQTAEADISVSVDVDPDTLNLEVHGEWITVYIEPPDGYKVSDIDISTVKLNGLLRPEHWEVQDGKLMMKFNADDVISQIIWPQISHMGIPMPQDNVPAELIVTGELSGGVSFDGSDIIRVMAPST